MEQDATSLGRLHDLVLPPPVPWWPLAAGWYVVLGIVALVVIAAGLRWWFQWRANAYRRAAIRALQLAETPAAISEVLRRTALVIAPRSTIAELTGLRWPEWLAARSPDVMSTDVRDLLAAGAYGRTNAAFDLDPLRRYAAGWIEHHRAVDAYEGSSMRKSPS